MSLYRIHPSDNVAVALRDMRRGEVSMGVSLQADLKAGHKAALSPIAPGGIVTKYAHPIGHATQAIAPGQHVHTHNVATNLAGTLEYKYRPVQCAIPRSREGFFSGYRRADGKVGVRNEIWIIPTVGCVNATAENLARAAMARLPQEVDGVYAFTHPYGCSQMGDDHARTQRLLAAMVRHPNAAGVLMLSLGCENNHAEAFKAVLGQWDDDRVKFLTTQDVPDEMVSGGELLDQLMARAASFARGPIDLSELVVGLKCGGSDGFSGITANPLLGAFSDRLTSYGGSTLLTEVPEMFGAETILMARCASEALFHKTVALINGYKQYFIDHGQVVYENPSAGNKDGGITTLEDKSLGCTQKGGTGPVMDVLEYAQPVVSHGLSLVYGPGNDQCALTSLMAAGAHIILFTTGRGTPYGGPVPTLKLSTGSELARRKPGWIDYDAGALIEGKPMGRMDEELFELVLRVAGGQMTRAENGGYRELCIWKDGVTL